MVTSAALNLSTVAVQIQVAEFKLRFGCHVYRGGQFLHSFIGAYWEHLKNNSFLPSERLAMTGSERRLEDGGH